MIPLAQRIGRTPATLLLAVVAGVFCAVAQAAEPAALGPFLQKHCVACHSAQQKEGGVSLEPLLATGSVAATADLRLKVFEQLMLNRMPPESEPWPSEAARGAVVNQLEAELRSVGRESDVRHKLLSPDYGNYVPHRRLFDGSERGPASSPPRLWRLRPDIYDRMIDGLHPLLRFAAAIDQPFPLDDEKGMIADYAAANFADGATLERLLMNCEAIAALETTGIERRHDAGQPNEKVSVVRSTQKEFEAVMSAAGMPTRPQMDAAIRKEFLRVLGREPDQQENERFVELLTKACREAGNAKGLALTLTAIMLQGEAVFRMELGLSKPDRHGRRLLSPHELAYAVSFALTDRAPVAAGLEPPKPNSKTKTGPNLLERAEAGQLSTRDDVERSVRELLSDTEAVMPRLLGFFHQFFGYQQAPSVFKGSRIGREYAPSKIVKDADELVMRILHDDRDVLRRLLTTEEYCVAAMPSAEQYHATMKRLINAEAKRPDSPNSKYFAQCKAHGLNPMPEGNHDWRRYVRFYNLDERTWNYPIEQPFAMPANQRAGLLTHPAWLIAWSGNFDNDVVRRGKWIREHLLADVVPEVPITVNAAVPEDPHKTLRERMAVTREEYCWQCHRKMDPLGLPFESFDDFGRFRSEETTADTTKHPLDARGTVYDSHEVNLDGDVSDARELCRKLADSTRARQSFVRHAFRYWMGRNETLADSPTLMAADRAYVESGGSFRALVVSLLTSDSFLYRK